MTREELKPGQMITEDGKEFYKVSTLHSHGFTAVLEFPIPQRTTVVRFSYEDNQARPLTEAEFDQYSKAWNEVAQERLGKN